MRRLVIAAVAAAALTPALPASAATPESGKVSASSPTVSWTGTLTRPYLTHIIFAEEGLAGATGAFPCRAPACDTFTLEVADGPADLAFVLTSEQTSDISLRIQDPDGAWTYYDGWSDGGTGAQKFTLKKAKNGSYTINIVARVFGTGNPTAVDDTADYKATATLAVAKPVAAPVVAPATPPAAETKPPAPATKPAPAKKKKTASKKATCRKKAKRIKNKRKRAKALKRCAKLR